MVDSIGYTTAGQAAYNINRSDTIAFGYGFMRNEFLGDFGSSQAHMVGMQYEKKLRRYFFTAGVAALPMA